MAFGGSKNRVRVQAGIDGIPEVTSGLDKMRNKFKAVSTEAGKGVLSGVGIGAGISAFNLFDDAASAAINVIGDSIQAASDLNETLTKGRQIFGDSAGAIEAWAATADTAFGQSKRQAIDTASGFAGLFKNIGIAGGEIVGMSEKITGLGSDLASFFNTDVQSALDALKSGLDGESKPLRQFNIFLSDTAVSAKAVQLGMKRVNGEFTEGQKVQARYALILEQSKDAQGDFTRTSDGLANSQRTLAAEMENLQADIGDELLPVMVELARVAKEDGIPALKGLLAASKDLGPVFEALAQTGLPSVVDGMKRADDTTLSLTDRVRGLTDETVGALPGLGNIIKWGENWVLGAQGAGDATESLVGNFGHLGHAAGGTADIVAAAAADAEHATNVMRSKVATDLAAQRKQWDALKHTVSSTVDSIVDDLLEPEQLTLKLKGTKTELQNNIDALGKLSGIKHPTKAQQADMVDLKLRISEGKGEVLKLEGKLVELGKLKATDLIKEFHKLGVPIDNDIQKAAQLYGLLASLGMLTSKGRGDHPPAGGKVARASGGPVVPGGRYTVGEEGKEDLVMFAGGGGYVVPHHGRQPQEMLSASGMGGGFAPAAGTQSTVVHTQINLDGRVIAEVVDKHLYYEAARAPQSPYSG
jgi:hypothetical protein